MEQLRDTIKEGLASLSHTVLAVHLDPNSLRVWITTADREDCQNPYQGYKCLVCRDTGIVRHQFFDQYGRDWGFACYCPAGTGVGGEGHEGISAEVYQKLLNQEREKHGIKPF